MLQKMFLYAIGLVFLCTSAHSQSSQSDTVWSKYIGSEVKAVKFSPDGQFIYAAALGRGPLKLRTETGEILTEFGGMVYNHSQNKYSLDISMDGNFLYAADTGRYIFKYDTKSGIVVDKIETPYSDKKGIFYRALTISDLYIGVLIIYDAPTGNDPLKREGVVIVFDKNTKEIVKEIKTKIINRVKFSPNGEYLCLYESAENNQDTRSILLNTENWEEYTTFIHGKVSISDISFSPDGSLLASCGWDGFIKIWDVKERKLIREINEIKTNQIPQLTALKFYDNFHILANGYIEDKSYVKIWDIQKNQLKVSLRTSLPYDIDLSKINQKSVIALGNGLLLFDIENYITGIDKSYGFINQIIPNPISSGLQIKFVNQKNDIYDIEIFDSSTKLISSIYNDYLEEGEHFFKWDASNYPSGTYYCIIKSSSYSDTLKIIVQK